ncbi:diguanylate cyclase [Gallaecimonas sp. GXIMD4217]|uniref:sensor domain-containing diguanylate cyclase n=1 Tax=Gallaecimonas sp. GXIMD4217 TaxID=3131927 RepID=UPI00311AF51D
MQISPANNGSQPGLLTGKNLTDTRRRSSPLFPGIPNGFRTLCQALLAVALLCLFPVAVSASGSTMELNSEHRLVADHNLWYPLEPSLLQGDLAQLKSHVAATEPVKGSIIGRAGAFITHLELASGSSQTWFVIPSANFIDSAVAYWQPEGKPAIKLARLSQLGLSYTPRIMHARALPLPMAQDQRGTLWLAISAKHFPTPVSISLYSHQAFSKHQLLSNYVTGASIVVMLTLAFLALTIYMRTAEPLTLTCAGYVGLHGIGWAAAAGVLNDLLQPSQLNLTYAGMYLFPFAIACASLFTKALFNCQEKFPRLGKRLGTLAKAVTALGIVMLWLPFQITFYLSHLIAALWVGLSIWIGITMLSNQDFRAKYYLFGNLCYSLSLLYYVISHSLTAPGLPYPELTVVAALTIDCICILLSLSEWIKIKQNGFNRMFYEARIDPLTKVGNRLFMNEKLSLLCGHHIIAFIDFDGMKNINDTMGHDAGDRFLSQAAALMRERVAKTGEVFRTGGDEFVWLIQAADREELVSLVGQLDKTVSELEASIRKSWPDAGISFGLASSLDCKSTSECLRMADRAMYQHKKSKKKTRHQAPLKNKWDKVEIN